MKSELITRSLEVAVSSAGHRFPKLSLLSESSGNIQREYPLIVSTSTDGYGMVVLDVTLDLDRNIRLIEANGSNSGLTSVSLGSDVVRVSHIEQMIKGRIDGLNEPSVIIFPFKPGFMHLPEFYSRAHSLSAILSNNFNATIRNVDEDLGDEEVTIVCGKVPEIAEHIYVEESIFYFKERRVIFASNPNLLPQLIRLGRLNNMDLIGADIFHDGPLLHITHDKGKQQDIAEGTKVKPIYFKELWTKEDCVSSVLKFSEMEFVAVMKMNAGSGATGIEFFPTNMTKSAIHEKVESIFSNAKSSYGQQVELTIFPIRVFEFIQSTPFLLKGENHLWDIRMLCLIYPEFTKVLPTLIRICPEPFDGTSFDKDAVVSNLTDRPPSLSYVRSAFDESALQNLNIGNVLLKEMSEACASWCDSAWKFVVNSL